MGTGQRVGDLSAAEREKEEEEGAHEFTRHGDEVTSCLVAHRFLLRMLISSVGPSRTAFSGVSCVAIVHREDRPVRATLRSGHVVRGTLSRGIWFTKTLQEDEPVVLGRKAISAREMGSISVGRRRLKSAFGPQDVMRNGRGVRK